MKKLKIDPAFREIRPKPGGSGIPSRELIHRIIQAVTNLLFIENLDDLLEEIGKAMKEVFQIELVTIWLADGNRREPRVALGYPEEKRAELMSTLYTADEVAFAKKHANFISPNAWFVPAEVQYLIGLEERNYHFILNPEAVHEPRESPDSWHELDYLDLSFISRDGKYVGAIEIEMPMDRKIPSVETVRAMEVFASICSIAIELARYREKEQAISDAAGQRSEQISRILSFTRDVLALEDPETVLRGMLRIMRDLFNFRATAIVLFDEREHCFKYVALEGYPKNDMEYAKTLRLPPEAVHFDISEQFMISRNAAYIPVEKLPERRLIWDIYSPDDFEDLKMEWRTPRADSDAWHPSDILSFTIQDRHGQVVGVLYPDLPADGLIPKAATIDGIAIFTSLVSMALENAKDYSMTLKAKENIELLNRLLFHDVSMINRSIEDVLELAIAPGVSGDRRTIYVRSALGKLDELIELIQRVRGLSSIQTMDKNSFLRIDLSSVVSTQLSRAVKQFPNKRPKIIYDVRVENCFVMANDMIGELFNDVISDSIKRNYRDDPEIVVSISGLYDEFNDYRYWDVKIADNGPGISDDEKNSVFDMGASIPEPGRRTDVGFFAIKSLAMAFGGSVWLEDRVTGDHSKGSVLHMLFPAA